MKHYTVLKDFKSIKKWDTFYCDEDEIIKKAIRLKYIKLITN